MTEVAFGGIGLPSRAASGATVLGAGAFCAAVGVIAH